MANDSAVPRQRQMRLSSRSRNKIPYDSQGSKSLSINRLKTKIRDTTRLLNRPEKLPPDIKIEKERALAGYQHDLEQANKIKRKKQMIKKYHMVRFFERKKASRILKQAQKLLLTLNPGSAEHQSVLEDIHNAEVDLNYTMYHPLDEKYHSLYPPKAGEAAQDEGMLTAERLKGGEASKPAVWAVVEKCMRAGTLIALRDGKLGRKLPEAEAKASSSITRRRAEVQKAQGEDASSSRDYVMNDEEKESDGGFFEK